MISKAQIKFIRSLTLKKYRKQYKSFIAEGDKTICEILNSPLKVQTLYATESWIEKNSPFIDISGLDLILVKNKDLNRMSDLKTAPPVLALVAIPEKRPDAWITESSFSIVLDSVRDPGNVGTIIRIADWFGIRQIFCSEDSADIYNPKVVQATMGSIARTRVYYQDLSRLFENHRLPILGTAIEGGSIFEATLPEKGFLIIGNESNGISEPLKSYVNQWISIPGFGGAESLNAGVATGIISAFWRKHHPSVKLR